MNNIQIQIQAIDNASAALNQVRDSLSSVNNAGKGLSSLSSGLASAASSAMGFIGAQAAMYAFGAGLNNAKSAFIDFNATMETARKSFENMLGSKDAAAVFINQLQAFAESTPFDFPELQQASKMMLGLGWAAKDILPALEAVGNAAANAGLSGGEISNIVMSISQMRGAGKIDAQNLKELDRRGVGATKILQDAYGMSIEEIQKSGKNVNEVVDTLIKGMNEKFKGAMETQQGTYEQLFSNVKDQTATILGEVGKPIFEIAKEGLKGIGDITAGLARTIREGGLAKVFDEMVPMEWQEKIKTAFGVIEQIFKSWTPAFAMFGDTVMLAFELFARAISNPAVVGAFILLNDVLVAATETFLSLGNAILVVANEGWKELEKSATDLASAFVETGKAIYDAVNESFTGTVDFIYEILRAAWDFIQSGWDECVGDTRSSLSPLGKAVFDVFKGVYNTIREIMDQIIKMAGDKMQSVVDTILSYLGIIDEIGKSMAGLSDMFQPKSDWAKGSGDVATRSDGTVVIGGTQKIKAGVMPGVNINAGYVPPVDFKAEQNRFEKTRSIVTKRSDELKGKNDLAASGAGVGGYKGSGASGGGGGRSRGGSGAGDDEFISFEDNFREIENENAIISAKLLGDKKALADAEYQIEVEKLAKERDERLQDASDQLELDKWYNGQVTLLEKERDEKKRDADARNFEMLIESNQLQIDLGWKTQEEIDQINRAEMLSRRESLTQQLNDEKLNAEERIKILRELADIKDAIPSTTAGGGFFKGLEETSKSFGTWAENMEEVGRRTAMSMQSAFEDFFFDAMTGELKSLGDYINSFLKGVARAISNALANAFTQKIISGMLGGGSSNDSGGGLFSLISGLFKAEGGPVYSNTPYIVGERGPELFVPSANGSIVPNHALGGGSSPVVINVVNNTGVKAEVRQESKFDGQRYIVSVFMDAYTKNIGGLRTAMAGARG